MRGSAFVQVAFAVGTAGLGVLGLVYGDFALQWQPVPAWIPLRHALAYASAAFLLACGIGLLFERAAARCALALAVYELVWVLARAAPVFSHPMHIGRWLGFSEAVALALGCWILGRSLVTPPNERGVAGLRGARALFGASCIVFGLSHFAYATFTADMVPRWLPARLALAYLTGAGHVAAGLALLFAIRARLAATLEALMLGSFVALVHVPSLFATPPPAWAPAPQVQWTALWMAWVLAASAGAVATSLGDSK